MTAKITPIGRRPAEVKAARGGSDAPSQSMAAKPMKTMSGTGRQDMAKDAKLGAKKSGKR